MVERWCADFPVDERAGFKLFRHCQILKEKLKTWKVNGRVEINQLPKFKLDKWDRLQERNVSPGERSDDLNHAVRIFKGKNIEPPGDTKLPVITAEQTQSEDGKWESRRNQEWGQIYIIGSGAICKGANFMPTREGMDFSSIPRNKADWSEREFMEDEVRGPNGLNFALVKVRWKSMVEAKWAKSWTLWH